MKRATTKGLEMALLILCAGLLAPGAALASGPDVAPPTWTILGADVAGTDAVVRWHIDWQAYGQLEVDELDLEAASRQVLQQLGPIGVRSARLVAVPFGGDAAVDLVALMPSMPGPAARPWEAAPNPAIVGHGAAAGEAGALSGKTVYLSPGHGLYWSTVLDRWATQRGNTHSLVEDFVNAEGALHYLEPLLRAAGAQVIGVRELDLRTDMVIVDDGDAMTANSGGYQDDGGWKTGASAGFANGKAPYTGQQNPFALGGYRFATATKGAATATATAVPKFPTQGYYRVTMGWTSGANRVKDAHVEIRHAGGVTHVRVDQSRHGQSWWPLGTYAFAAGVDPQKGAVLVHNDSLGDPSGKVVVADVVRFGGGMGEIVRGNGNLPAKGPTTGRPRWESAARYYTQFAGAPPTVWDASSADNNDDVTSRSRFSGWHHETGDDAVYLSWHTNAPDPGRGTSTYVYGPNPPDGSKNYQATKGSAELGGWLQKTIVADIRAEFDPLWKDRGLYSAYFGEVNPVHNPDMPAVLVEAAFHSTLADADFLREPRFRYAVARAMTKAIIRYFAERDGLKPTLPPEPPLAVRVAIADGSVTVAWVAGPIGGAAGDAATGFVVETSADGFAFAAATEVAASPAKLDAPPPGTPLYVRLRARNAGGVSLPTATFGAVRGCPGADRALAVQAFSRLQASQLPVDDLSPWGLGNIQRLRQWRVNRFDYLVAHLTDLANAGLAVDSADRAALPQIQLKDYRLIDWAAGEQSTTDGVLTAQERGLIATWMDDASPRGFLISGSEIGWALDEKGDSQSADWMTTWLGATLADDDAGTYKLAPTAGVALAWAGASFDNGDGGSYDVDWPDSFALAGGSAVIDYVGGKGGVAAVLHKVGKAHSVLMGVPLETILPASARTALVAALLSALEVQGSPAPCPGGGGGDTDAGTSDAGTSDAGTSDAGTSDAGASDAGTSDANTVDTTASDASGQDAHPADGDSADGNSADALSQDINSADAAVAEAVAADGGGAPNDGVTGQGDAGSGFVPADPGGCGCNVHGGRSRPDAGGVLLALLCLALLQMRRGIAQARVET